MNYYIKETQPGANSRVLSQDGFPHEWESFENATETLARLQQERPRNTLCLIPVTPDGKEIVKLILGRNDEWS